MKNSYELSIANNPVTRFLSLLASLSQIAYGILNIMTLTTFKMVIEDEVTNLYNEDKFYELYPVINSE